MSESWVRRHAVELGLGIPAAAALIALRAWLLPFGGTKVIVSDPPAQGPATSGKPDDLLDEIAQRPMWTEPPQTFSDERPPGEGG